MNYTRKDCAEAFEWLRAIATGQDPQGEPERCAAVMAAEIVRLNSVVQSISDGKAAVDDHRIAEERQRATYWRNRAKSVEGRANVKAFKRVDAMLSEALGKLACIRGDANDLLRPLAAESARSPLYEVLCRIWKTADPPKRPPRPSHRDAQVRRSRHG